ncbi:MAG: DedA family protein [Pyrinomonadaceae bacterium]
MEQTFYQLFEQYGIYAVLALCTIEGDITLLLAGVLAHNGYFGHFSFLKVYIFGTLGGMIGDTFGYAVGRLFQQSVKNYSFYKMAQPRIERLVDKFGGFAVIVSKYIYGIRTAMCLFNGVGRMPLSRFLFLDFISCSVWVLILTSVGYFFSGAITTIIGDFKQIGIAVFFIVLFGIIVFYLIERYLLSERIEEASPETILKLEEKIHHIEEKLHIGHVAQRIHGTGDQKNESGSTGGTENAGSAVSEKVAESKTAKAGKE